MRFVKFYIKKSCNKIYRFVFKLFAIQVVQNTGCEGTLHYDIRELSAMTNDVNYERIEGVFPDFSSLCFDRAYVQRAIEDV